MSSSDRDDGAAWRNFYGRRHGKALRPGHRRLLGTLLEDLSPGAVTREANPDRTPLDLPALFPAQGPLWLEIGFGGGEHMIAQAQANPGVGIIGCEPFINGVAMLLAAVERAGVRNLRIHPGDARDLMDLLPQGAVERAFLLYPDPWPKRRHWPRRFVRGETLDQLARVMAPGADQRLATDVPDYVRHSVAEIGRHPDFEWVEGRIEACRTPWADWPGTRYEAKALLAGRRPDYLTFRRL
jgi:tRNA (guanine-N7-)-methyltransferase